MCWARVSLKKRLFWNFWLFRFRPGSVIIRNPVLEDRVAPCFPWFLSFVCVFITAGPSTKLFAWGGVWIEPKTPGWAVCVYYCSTYYKAFREGRGGGMEDMCYERLRAKAYVN